MDRPHPNSYITFDRIKRNSILSIPFFWDYSVSIDLRRECLIPPWKTVIFFMEGVQVQRKELGALAKGWKEIRDAEDRPIAAESSLLHHEWLSHLLCSANGDTSPLSVPIGELSWRGNWYFHLPLATNEDTSIWQVKSGGSSPWLRL